MIKFDENTLSELMKSCKTQDDLFGENGLIKALMKRGVENILEHEMSSHLGYDKHASNGQNTGNSRNGYSQKTVRTDNGEVELSIPRDRTSNFRPQIIPKNSKNLGQLDKQILFLYGKGMSTRDIQDQLQTLYGTEVSPQFISTVTDGVMDDVIAWRNRPLDQLYPIVYLDCIVIKIKENKQITNHAVYFALGVNMDGQKELLGMWISQNEGSKFWLSVLTELKNRGLEDILIACVDGLTGFPEAIEAVYPKTTVQLCVVHLIRNSVKYVSYKDRKELCADLKPIYKANTLEEAENVLGTFSDKWDKKYPNISQMWFNHWDNIVPFFEYPDAIRRVIYTTNAIESMNMTMRKVIKNKRMFPTENSAFKLLYLALDGISKKWTMPIQDWGTAMNHFMIKFGERVTKYL